MLLDSLQQREAALNTEVADLQRTLASLQASGSSDQAAIENAQARLAALSILIGTVAATGPGVTLTIDGHRHGAGAGDHARCDQRAAERRRRGDGGPGRAGRSEVSVRVGVDTWVGGTPGALVIDGQTLNPPYTVVAIGDPPTLAAAMNIPGGAMDSVERVGGNDGGATIRPGGCNRLAATESPPIRSAREVSPTCEEERRERNPVRPCTTPPNTSGYSASVTTP